MPVSVTRDKRLSLAARVVFAELASWTGPGKNIVTRGQRSIAKAVGVHVGTVNNAVHELADKGHLKIQGEGHARRRYILLSPVFRFMAEADSEVIEYSNIDGVVHRRIVEARTA